MLLFLCHVKCISEYQRSYDWWTIWQDESWKRILDNFLLDFDFNSNGYGDQTSKQAKIVKDLNICPIIVTNRIFCSSLLFNFINVKLETWIQIQIQIQISIFYFEVFKFQVQVQIQVQIQIQIQISIIYFEVFKFQVQVQIMI